MTRHECPDCGHVHELKAEERIKRLEERVRELETMPRWPLWFNNTYRSPNTTPIIYTTSRIAPLT